MQLTLIWVLHHRHRSLLVLTYRDDFLVYLVGKVAKHRKIIVTLAVMVFVTLVMVTMVIVMVVKVVVMVVMLVVVAVMVVVVVMVQRLRV